LHYSARIQHEVREPVSAQCNMAVRDDLSSGDARRLAHTHIYIFMVFADYCVA